MCDTISKQTGRENKHMWDEKLRIKKCILTKQETKSTTNNKHTRKKKKEKTTNNEQAN